MWYLTKHGQLLFNKQTVKLLFNKQRSVCVGCFFFGLLGMDLQMTRGTSCRPWEGDGAKSSSGIKKCNGKNENENGTGNVKIKKDNKMKKLRLEHL